MVGKKKIFKELEEVSELIEKFEDVGIVNSLVKEGKIDPFTLSIISRANLFETYGWTIKEYEETDLFWIDAFGSVLKGRYKGIKSKYPKK